MNVEFLCRRRRVCAVHQQRNSEIVIVDMDGPVIEAPCGKLRGSRETSVGENFDFCSFKGVPYAKPPVGELRFRDPVSLERWTGIRDATKCGSQCAQIDLIYRTYVGSDDCLYLNIYVKNVKKIGQKPLLPVMVWIHGGGFCRGSGDDSIYGPDYLIRKDVVLVTFNYRLAVLGFLNLEDPVASGNQGLKDQVMLLRWVKDNIASFGGDPNNVTIFGESAGAASVHYLGLSHLADGLFHKAISQSGVAINTWASIRNDPRRMAFQLCTILGKSLKDPREIVEFLRTIDCEKLIKAQEKLLTRDEKMRFLFPFGPAPDYNVRGAFLRLPADDLARQAMHVPLLIGYNSREGLYLFGTMSEDGLDDLDRKFERWRHPTVKKMMESNNLSGDDLKRLYFKSNKITPENLENYVDLLSDEHFVYGIHKTIRYQVESGSASTYMYQLTYDPGESFMKTMTNVKFKGVSHAEDLTYIFDMKMLEQLGIKGLQKGTTSYKIMEQMTELWTNFAKYGRPTVQICDKTPFFWQPVSDGTILRYLNIGEELKMDKVLNIEEKLGYKKYMRNKL